MDNDQNIIKMTKEEAKGLINKEFATAKEAARVDNLGMVRVCARRAAGISIRYWLQGHPRKFWGNDAMNQLRNVQLDQGAPQGVRSAAHRLTSKIRDEMAYQKETNPIEDSRVIIEYYLESD